jgi:microsomal prostaglandin-E synthase 1
MLQALGSGANQTFFAYGLTTLFLSLNLLLLWISSGTLRARSGVAINPEDGARYGVPVSVTDPPAVARILRVHRNAEATTYPFLALGLVYVLIGGSVQVAAPIFTIFTLSRIAHSIVYLKAMQPWRTLTFAASLLSILALMAADLHSLLAA